MINLKFYLCLCVLAVVSCSYQESGGANVSLAQSNKTEVSTPTPSRPSAVPSPEPSPASKLNCGKNITGTSKQIQIPDELCFNEKLPADKSEAVGNPPKGVKQANTLSEGKVSVREVSPEVLRVISLISGSNLKPKYFWLAVSSNGSDSTKRAIKMYSYSPLQDDGEPGDLSANTFYFQKQNGKMKFVSAEIAK